MSTNKDSAVEHIAVSVKGVTHYNRQDILKHLYDQKLPKEEKHLSLEKYTDGRVETYVVIMNGFKIGTLPQDCLETIFYPAVNYELSNIHIGKMTVENGRIIYYAKLFITLTPVEESQCLPKKKTCIECGNEIQELQGLCSDCYSKFNDVSNAYKESLSNLAEKDNKLSEAIEKNKNLNAQLIQNKKEYERIQKESRIKKNSPNIIAVIVAIVSIILFLVTHSEKTKLNENYLSLKEEYDVLSDKVEDISILKYTNTINKGDDVTIAIYIGTFLPNNKEDYSFSLYNSDSKEIVPSLNFKEDKNTSKDGCFQINVSIPEEINPGNYYFNISYKTYSLNLPLTIKKNLF